jgi:excisionase family DNA binding protein
MLTRVEPLNVRHDLVNWEELTQKPFLIVSEAYLVLNVMLETLRRWIRDGVVKANRVGKKHLISREFLLNSQIGLGVIMFIKDLYVTFLEKKF